jgi:myosin-9
LLSEEEQRKIKMIQLLFDDVRLRKSNLFYWVKLQLRYTGMLETVRIRRAGYNVRLTYEEFIQLYRILLPKGLLSTQKNVRDFMNTMDLNKQHYQLGLTKIYMRESQKIRLDIKLHEKIIRSIVTIQRWFRSILQRRKFLMMRSATVVIQSGWRMVIAQRQVMQLKQHIYAATMIQATWRMYWTKKWFVKLKGGVVVVQSHIRGKLARKEYRLKQKLVSHFKFKKKIIKFNQVKRFWGI